MYVKETGVRGEDRGDRKRFEYLDQGREFVVKGSAGQMAVVLTPNIGGSNIPDSQSG